MSLFMSIVLGSGCLGDPGLDDSSHASGVETSAPASSAADTPEVVLTKTDVDTAEAIRADIAADATGGTAPDTVGSLEEAPLQETAASGGTAPACIQRKVHTVVGYAIITNHCGKAMSVNVIVKHGSDSGCWTLPKTKSLLWPWISGPQSYSRTVVC